MNDSSRIADRYHHLMQEDLINAIYQDRAMGTCSHTAFLHR